MTSIKARLKESTRFLRRPPELSHDPLHERGLGTAPFTTISLTLTLALSTAPRVIAVARHVGRRAGYVA
jgi:hypothetical protein